MRVTASGREALTRRHRAGACRPRPDLPISTGSGLPAHPGDGHLPILMLTARDDDRQDRGPRVAQTTSDEALQPAGFFARVRAILPPQRRPGAGGAGGGILEHGELVLDAGRRECHVGDEEIRLAPKEFDLLWELIDHKGLVLTRDQLLERVWGYTFAGDTRTVDVHVRQLRRKLGDA